MRLRRPVRVVCFVGVREDAVDERGIHRSGEDVRPDDRGHGAARLGARERKRGAAGRQLGARHHGRDRVEDVVLRFLGDLRRKRAVFGSRHVRAERGHDRTDGLRTKPDRWQG